MQVFADTQASFYTAGVAVQWYLDTAAAPTKLRQTHDRHPEKFILLTEVGETVLHSLIAPKFNRIAICIN
jgi:hypothetical protein